MRAWSGSSPLARGTPRFARSCSAFSRLIPARAGNTQLPQKMLLLTSAHPRSRGEHAMSFSSTSCAHGSSPLARGTRLNDAALTAKGRLIPARAGNTQIIRGINSSRSAHPRSRGEHLSAVTTSSSSGGSSPLARGTLVDGYTAFDARRLIPARAGNTARLPAFSGLNSAHPRSRGEHRRDFNASTPRFGSSPLARGTPITRLTRNHNRRLIPARAGNTPVQCPQ